MTNLFDWEPYDEEDLADWEPPVDYCEGCGTHSARTLSWSHDGRYLLCPACWNKDQDDHDITQTVFWSKEL